MSWKVEKTYIAKIEVSMMVDSAVVRHIEDMLLEARRNKLPNDSLNPKIEAIKYLRDVNKIHLNDGRTYTIGLKDAKEIVENISAGL